MKRVLSVLFVLLFCLTVSMSVFSADDVTVSRSSDSGYVAVVLGCAVVVPFLVAFVMMKIQLSKMNTAVADDYAANYEKTGSYHLDLSQDIFLYSRISKVKKANPPSSGNRR